MSRGPMLSRWEYWTGVRPQLPASANFELCAKIDRSYYGTDAPTRFLIAQDRIRQELWQSRWTRWIVKITPRFGTT